MTGENGWLRGSSARALMLAAFAVSLVLGVAFLVVDSSHRPEAEVAMPLTDEQARDQVVASARQIVAVARLQHVTGGAIFLSCKNEHDPPYQAAVYLNFAMPESNSVKRIGEIAAAMVADGWQEAPSAAEHFGRKLTKNGVTSTFHRNPDAPGFGTMRIYGECRNTADHRNDNPAWTDVTGRIS